jgi:hypothetical protein
MNRHLKVVAMLLAFLLSVSSLLAQTPKTIKIGVVATTGVGADAEVRSLVVPLLVTNPHFTLVSDSSWDMMLMMDCNYTAEGERRDGVACAYVVRYSPDDYLGVEYSPGPMLSIGPDVNSIAHSLATAMLDLSTPDKWQEATKHLDTLFAGIYKQITDYNKAHSTEPASAPKQKQQ